MLSNQQTATGVLDEAKREEFSKLWGQVQPQVAILCRRSFRDANDGEDVLGRVALRAARSFAAFRGESSFSTWVIAIARREIARVHARESTRQSREVSLEIVTETAPERLPSHSDSPGTSVKVPTRQQALKALIKRAVLSEELSQPEADVVLARIAQPKLGWSELGEKLGMDGTTCAVVHCRAVPKLRVFLFLRYPSFMGTPDAIEEAFQAARDNSKEPLSVLEADIFRSVVLEKKTTYRKAGWKLALRAACSKVVKKLPLP